MQFGANRAAVIEGLQENPIRAFSLSDVVVDSAATGISCLSSRELRFDNVLVNAESGPAVSFNNVRNLELFRVRSDKAVADQPVIRMERVENAAVTSCAAAEGSRVLLEVKGAESHGIVLALNRVPKGVQEFALAAGASAGAVEKRA